MIAPTVLPQCLEAGMLVCFGVSWPVDILKLLRSRRTEGKSLAFMVIILIGYCLGLTAKFIHGASPDVGFQPVAALYALNLLFVAIDIALYLRFRRQERAAE